MMISFLLPLLVFSLPNIIETSVPFIQNPGCNLPQCEQFGSPALFYANHFVGEETVHIIYSSLAELTITIFSTPKNYGPSFNYTALFAGNFLGAIQFDGYKPLNSFSFVLRRLLQFVDENDNGKMDDNNNLTTSYYFTNLITTNVTFRNNNTDQPSFQFPLDTLNGSVSIDIVYPGAAVRDTKFPKLKTTPKGFFVNIALQANGFSSKKTRFAFELLFIAPGVDGLRSFSQTYIDDQYTPGIFKVWQMREIGPLYLSSMLWKPVVYQSADRTIEQNTLMEVYKIVNSVTLDSKHDQGVYLSILPQPTVSAMNVSLGQANDGFFTKTNYTFIQFTASLDHLDPDATGQFISIALIISLALPAFVALIAVIFILKRRCTQQPASSYDAIQD